MDTVWTSEAVGEAAGSVWQHLKDNGRMSLTGLEKAVDAPPSLVHMAVGWLAREGKIGLELEKRTLRIWLQEP